MSALSTLSDRSHGPSCLGRRFHELIAANGTRRIRFMSCCWQKGCDWPHRSTSDAKLALRSRANLRRSTRSGLAGGTSKSTRTQTARRSASVPLCESIAVIMRPGYGGSLPAPMCADRGLGQPHDLLRLAFAAPASNWVGHCGPIMARPSPRRIGRDADKRLVINGWSGHLSVVPHRRSARAPQASARSGRRCGVEGVAHGDEIARIEQLRQKPILAASLAAEEEAAHVGDKGRVGGIHSAAAAGGTAILDVKSNSGDHERSGFWAAGQGATFKGVYWDTGPVERSRLEA
eukprot:scaffold243671_cov35-Tisochrysis_lutea.AAC.3